MSEKEAVGKEPVGNVLAQRYASEAMQRLWSESGRVRLERDFWIAVMRAQESLGLSLSPGAVAAYEAVKEKVDLPSIRAREAVTRHDVKARIEEFNALAGREDIHKGMTSRDLTENVEQLQVYRSLQLVQKKVAAVLLRLAVRMEEDSAIVLAGRTHNVAAQPTTVGKRWAMFAEELLWAARHLEFVRSSYPSRGLKGAVGTQVDLLTLFAGAEERATDLDAKMAAYLGLPACLVATGQVYPRSLDFGVVAALVQVASPIANFARTLRLMAGHELASEGFAPGQTGSSAMPHKMNARSCERVGGFLQILKGHLSMASGLLGDQWNEGDVSCSVVRRVFLPDVFFAMDGLLETFLTIVGQMEVYAEVVDAELAHYLPFLATTTILMESVKAGAGRETAHAAIKEHALATARDLRRGAVVENDLVERLAHDARISLNKESLAAIVATAREKTGRARAQVGAVAQAVRAFAAAWPQARDYEPGAIL